MGLFDLYGGGDPTDFTAALQSKSNSLAGLGLGLLAHPGAASALQGYEAGSKVDAADNANRALMLRHAQDRQDKLSQQAWARNQAGITDAQRAWTDKVNAGVPNTPENQQAHFKDWYVKKGTTPWRAGPEGLFNEETGEQKPFNTGNPAAATAPSPFPPSPFTAPPSPAEPPAGGGGGVSVGPPGPGAVGFLPGNFGTTPASPIGPAGAAPTAARGMPPRIPGASYTQQKEYDKIWQGAQAKQDFSEQAGAGTHAADAQNVMDQIDFIQKLRTEHPIAVGIPGAQHLPYTHARDQEQALQVVRSNSSLDKLRQMRKESSSGASGLGQVTEKEHTMLQNSIAALDQFQTPESFSRNLESVKKHYHEAIYGPGTYRPQNKMAPAAPTAAPAAPTRMPNAGAIGYLRANPQ